MSNTMVKKEDLEPLIDGFIFESLSKKEYKKSAISPLELLTSNRIDLAFKLFYLDTRNKNKILAEEIYMSDIKAQTNSKFVEYGNEERKYNFSKYIEEFNNISDEIKSCGFDDTKSLVPLSTNNTIINGAHRVASAVFHNKNISTVKTEFQSMNADYDYFYKRKISSEHLDLGVNKFIEYADNVYIAFLWPSGQSKNEEAESLFSNIVYKKQLNLNYNGALNLLIELYKHMDWVGTEKNGYEGVLKKIKECFPDFSSFTVIVFQSTSLEKVQEIKAKVRKLYNIGFSSIHITDTKNEAKRIGKLIFNKNGIHFLNYASPYRYKELFSSLKNFDNFLFKNGINKEDVIIDGSTVLTLYGLRKNLDVDCLYSDSVQISYEDPAYESHDSELKYHQLLKEDLIYNPKYYFEYLGYKFVSFDQLYQMKYNRNETKDVNDCSMMISLIKKDNLKRFFSKQKQNLLYLKVKIKRNLFFGLSKFLKKIRVHHVIKPLYKKIIKK